MRTHTIHSLLAICAMIAAAAFAAPDAPPPDMGGKMPHPPHPPADAFANWGRGNEIMVVMEELKKSKPEEYARLTELRKTDKQAFFTEIKKHMPKPRTSMHAMFRLENECRSLANAIAGCNDKEVREKLEKMLRDKLKESFDFMIQDSTERIEKMRKQLEALKANEDAILDERFKQFTSPEFAKEREGWQDKKGQRPPKPNGRPGGMMPPPPPPPEPPNAPKED